MLTLCEIFERTIKCEYCQGKGKLTKYDPRGSELRHGVIIQGVAIGVYECPECKGNGKLELTYKIEVKLCEDDLKRGLYTPNSYCGNTISRWSQWHDRDNFFNAIIDDHLAEHELPSDITVRKVK